MKHGGDIYRNHIEYDFSVNLNPMGCPPEVTRSVQEGMQNLSEYPDLEQEAVRRALAGFGGVAPECVLGGNGASELICAVTASINPKRALMVSPGFTGYEHALAAGTDADAHITIDRYFLSDKNGFRIDEDILEYIGEDTDIIYLCNPHNPTGLNIPGDLLTRICGRSRDTGSALVVDESFLYMSEHPYTLAGRIDEYQNLYVIGSFTKLFAIPGLRVGYLFTCRDNAGRVMARLPEWNMSVPAQYAATACAGLIGDTSFMRDTMDVIRRERTYIADGIRAISDSVLAQDKKISVYDSDSSYMLISSDTDLYHALLGEGILIRDLSDAGFADRRFFRIAVRDHDSNCRLMETLEKVVNE